jgi:hypothetical protein
MTSAVIRITVDRQADGHTVRLPDVPSPGDEIELADGTLVVVREIVLRTRGIVAADVRARTA